MGILFDALHVYIAIAGGITLGAVVVCANRAGYWTWRRFYSSSSRARTAEAVVVSLCLYIVGFVVILAVGTITMLLQGTTLFAVVAGGMSALITFVVAHRKGWTRDMTTAKGGVVEKDATRIP